MRYELHHVRNAGYDMPWTRPTFDTLEDAIDEAQWRYYNAHEK